MVQIFWKKMLLIFSLLLLHVYEHFICIYVCAHLCQQPGEVRRRPGIPWNWSCKWLCNSMRVLGIKPCLRMGSGCFQPLRHLSSPEMSSVTALTCLYHPKESILIVRFFLFCGSKRKSESRGEETC